MQLICYRRNGTEVPFLAIYSDLETLKDLIPNSKVDRSQ